MALLFIDSFDHYNDATHKYLSGGTSITTGRHGNGYYGSLRCALNPAPTNPRTLIGAAIKLASTSARIWKVSDPPSGLNGTFTIHCQNDGSLGVQVGGGSTVSSLPDILRLNQWHYIETDITIQSVFTTPYYKYHIGPIKAYVDGVLIIDHPLLESGLSYVDPPTAGLWNDVDIIPSIAGVIDDLYIADGAGSAPFNALLGDIEIGVIRPNGVGALAEWTAVGAGTNWDTNNDTNPDGDTTHVVATTAPKSDLYEMEDVSTGNTIIAGQILVNARRTEEGFGNIAPLLRLGGTTTELTSRPLSSTYFYRNRDIFTTLPGGAPLSDANINAMQAGFKRTL